MQGPGGWYSSTATRATSRCPTPRSRSARWPAAGARPSPPASCPAVRWAGNIFVIYQIFFENTRKSTELAISHLVIHTHGKTEISFLLHISMTVSLRAQFGWGLAQTNKCKRHSLAQKCTKMWISTKVSIDIKENTLRFVRELCIFSHYYSHKQKKLHNIN